jgi:hypothetical protein
MVGLKIQGIVQSAKVQLGGVKLRLRFAVFLDVVKNMRQKVFALNTMVC